MISNSYKVQYDSINEVTIFEGNVSSVDEKGNRLFSEYAKYDKLKERIETEGDTKIITSGGYEIFGANITFDNKKSFIYSNNKTKIIDKDGNNIFEDMTDSFDLYIDIAKNAVNGIPHILLQNDIFKTYRTKKRLFPRKEYYCMD